MSEKFFENLKKARLRKGLSQVQLAEQLGVAKSTYSMYESGNREPNVQTIKKIADILNVSTDELLGMDEESQTIAAHFDGVEYTDEEMAEIRQFAQFVRMKRYKDALMEEPKLIKPFTTGQPEVNAAHADKDATLEDIRAEDAIMDDENF